jgi:3-isopropylmalate dehydrogenase
VYDLRERFRLFWKLNPIGVWPELDRARVLKPEAVRSADLVVVRETLSGLYAGSTVEVCECDGARSLEHRFLQSEQRVRRFLGAAARLAVQRSGRLAVVVKSGGLPELSAVWREAGAAESAAAGVEFRCLDIDFASYLMIQDPRSLDVVAAPNCFADILSDIGGVLMGGRGLTYGGSFGEQGEAVYQTNHGAAYELEGTGRANPLGQILSMAMLLRESFGLRAEADAVVGAVRRTLGRGVATADIAWRGCEVVGTAELTGMVVEEVRRG